MDVEVTQRDEQDRWTIFGDDIWLQIITGTFVVAYAISTLVVHRHDGYNTFWDGWEYNIAFSLPIIAMWRRSRRTPETGLAWQLLALGVALNTVATLVYTYHDQNLVPIPSPAPSDAFYLASYAAFIVGFAMLTQGRLGRVHASIRLDGAIAGLAMASLAGMLWFEPILKVSGNAFQVVVGMAYPLVDLVLVVLLIAGLAPNHYRPNWTTSLLMAGVISWVVVDTIYLKEQTAGTYVQSTLLDAIWPFGVFLMGLAASLRERRATGSPRPHDPSNYDITLMPVAAGMLSIVVIAFFFGFHHTSAVVLALALGALCLVIARMWLTLGEERHMVRNADRDARTDALTGLPNRRSFFESFDGDFTNSSDARAGVILLDLDGFKEVNDGLGHQAGDELLRVVAKRFEKAVHDRGVLARIGGDEFACAVVVRDEHELVDLANELVGSLANPCALPSGTVKVGASAGVALGSTDLVTSSELLRCADVAMYEAKRARAGVSVYRPSSDHHSREHRALVDALESAIERREIVMLYQPSIDLRTRTVRGVEALARWMHPQFGVLEPETFIPMAEDAGLMPRLTRLVLEQAVDTAAFLERQGRNLSMSVNISLFDLADLELATYVERLLIAERYLATQLTLEVTETALAGDPLRTVTYLAELHRKGVLICLDDFGTGELPMSQLVEFELDELKIDRTFMFGLSRNPRAQAFVRSAIEFAHALSIPAVAEGVEDAASLAVVAELGADAAQGFVIAEPLTRDELVEFLDRQV